MQQPPSQQSSGGATSELRSDAKDLGSTAANRIHNEVDTRKDAAVDQAKSVTNAIRSAADGLDEDAPSWIKSAFRQGADQIQRFADTIEQKDSRQILDEVQSFARERPAMFLGACAAAGFAASRVFKAGGEQQNNASINREFDQSEPWGSGEQAFDRQLEPAGQSADQFAPQQSLGQSGTDDRSMFGGSTGSRGSGDSR